MNGYVDLIDKRHIVARHLGESRIVARNWHLRTPEAARAKFAEIRQTLKRKGFLLRETHADGFAYQER